MWFLGKRESVNAWKKADLDGFREKDDILRGSLDHWNELKEVLRVQTRAEVAKILFDR
jgi:hypothetical protein